MSNGIPKEWSATNLGEICKFGGGSAFKEKYQGSGKGDFPFIKVSDMNLPGNEVFIRYSNNWISKSVLKEAKAKLFPSRSVVFAKVGAALLLNRRRILTRDTVIDNNMMAAMPHEKDNNFLYFLLQDIDFGTFVQGGAVPSINQSQMEDIPVLVPPLPEQQKIASILTAVDDVIESTQAQINKLKDLKTGMMQELLTQGIGHTEFRDSPVGRIPKAWTVCKVGEVLNVIESGWSPLCESLPARIGEWGVLKTTAVTWNGFNFEENKRLPDSLEPRPSIQVNVGDVLVTRAGPVERVGVVAHVEKTPEKIMLSDKLIRLTTNERCHSKFLALWLSGTYVQNYFSLHVSGLALSQTNISQEILRNPFIALPDLNEQKKISAALLSVESRIGFAAEKLSRVISSKKALMQDLLTGKVRVKVN